MQNEEIFNEEVDNSEELFDSFDAEVEDIDFSELKGKDFKKNFAKVSTKINKKRASKGFTKRINKAKPLTKEFFVKKKATVLGRNERKLSKVIVPRDKKVIIEGVSKFILSQDKSDESLRNIGYYKGKKLKELVFIINNDSLIDFNLSLFNPSEPLDYLYATSLSLNNKIQVAGGNVSYSDILFYILANPIAVRGATFSITGAQPTNQQAVALKFQNKSTTGTTQVTPVNLSLQVDNLQVDANLVSFDIAGLLNRPFIPDGMDVMNYTVLAGSNVVMCFYYEQKKIKKLFFPEAQDEPQKLM